MLIAPVIFLNIWAAEPIPDRLVVLTFDDASKSHYTVVRPILKKLGFGATFFVTEGFDFLTNKRDYMTWEQIAELHQDGFEIGNHTKDHLAVEPKTLRQLSEQLRGIELRCQDHGIPKPTSFAYPGNGIDPKAFPILKEHGIIFARRGGVPEHEYQAGRGFAYEPGLDHPLLIPSAGDARPFWTMENFRAAVDQARHGQIALLQFHGVPDTAHAWVNLDPRVFEQFMRYLKQHDFTVIALRDLARFVDPQIAPTNAWGVIEDRQQHMKNKTRASLGRKPVDQSTMDDWLSNMRVHDYSIWEMATALDISAAEVETRLKTLKAAPERRSGTVSILPFPGGRHPRIGFLDGAIRPQRETKISVFPPWSAGGYAVVDVPEAIWFHADNRRELLYLAHTHVPTFWDKRNQALPQLEWACESNTRYSLTRSFPNQTGYSAVAETDGQVVMMKFGIKNKSKQTLTGLSAQMCVMLKSLRGFEDLTNDNKVFEPPFSACKDRTGRRWIITAWQQCGRAWGNPPCPCLHSDPKLPDCPPNGSVMVRGLVAFFEGTDVRTELGRLRTVISPEVNHQD